VGSLLARGGAAAVVASCAVAVAVWGELSLGALVAVGTAGSLVVAVGLARRSGEAAPAVGRRALPWLVGLAAVASWEVTALLSDDLPTVSDLADPALAHPVLRAAATVAWLAGGAWLVARPHRAAGQALGAAMRTVPGRVAVLLVWLWLGVHFLAR
jgi:hypothetical protein